MANSNDVKLALYYDSWEFETGSKVQLRREAQRITTTEYTLDMRGNIFCPECCAPVFRSPHDRDVDSAGRRAFFAHSPSYTPECSLRVRRAEGRTFVNEELARQAIDDDELVVVSSFLTERPHNGADVQREYEGDHVEDIHGELTEVAISRHNGESFNLPSRITTVRGICRNFDRNYFKYYVLPGRNNAVQLRDLLVNVATVKEIDSSPKLYYGIVTTSFNCGSTPQNIRQTMFNYPRNEEYVDFCLKVTDQESSEHGITDSSQGRIVIMYGTVEESGIGLCIRNIGWGEFAVLPQQYEHFLVE
ncbi:hypothetical protein [Aeromonas bivalvium]|uniref:hypothetical protein n=1 Tax=Aeromonas bivalvium TaxID=440079 RepID=UPI0038D1829A